MMKEVKISRVNDNSKNIKDGYWILEATSFKQNNQIIFIVSMNNTGEIAFKGTLEQAKKDEFIMNHVNPENWLKEPIILHKYYSQFQEDEFIVKYCERYKIKLHPVAIEIGADNGIDLCNARHFGTEKGFKCIYVEPDAETFKTLVKNTADHNSICINAACVGSEYKGKTIGLQTDMSGFRHISDNIKILVDAISLPDILSKHDIFTTKIGILSIDVEGFEIPILDDVIKFNIRPQWLIIESNLTSQRIIQAGLLIGNGYVLHKMKDKNTLWMDGNLMTPEQDNAAYDIR